ncbi:MAG: histidine phosphatase family protein [SAR202 cluster bacterium]|nr:histidine phosphatase family protein [SAR202 cluster bacterium]
MLRVYLARHGRTEWNVQGRVQGGGPLDAAGRAQAEALARRLRGEPIDAVYASPTPRARQTARPVAKARGIIVHQSRYLVDLDYGKYGSMHKDDAVRDDPALWERWRVAPHTVVFPGGEGLAALRLRLLTWLEAMHGKWPGGTLFAATHDSPIRTVVTIARGLDDSHHHDEGLRAVNGALTLIEVDGHDIRLIAHNDTSHLPGGD